MEWCSIRTWRVSTEFSDYLPNFMISRGFTIYLFAFLTNIDLKENSEIYIRFVFVY